MYFRADLGMCLFCLYVLINTILNVRFYETMESGEKNVRKMYYTVVHDSDNILYVKWKR